MEKNIFVCKECGREVSCKGNNKLEPIRKHLKNNHLELFLSVVNAQGDVNNEEEVNNEEN